MKKYIGLSIALLFSAHLMQPTNRFIESIDLETIDYDDDDLPFADESEYAIASTSDQIAYDAICEQTPAKPMPRWQQMLNNVANAIFERYLIVKNFFKERFERLKAWWYRYRAARKINDQEI